MLEVEDATEDVWDDKAQDRPAPEPAKLREPEVLGLERRWLGVGGEDASCQGGAPS